MKKDSGLILPQDHIALSSSTSIKEICKPLERLGITYFSFVRSYNNSSHIRLSNNPDWTSHYYKKCFYNVVIKQVPDAEGNLLWSSIDRYPLFDDASEYYNIDNGTVIVLNIDDITERYFFGSTKDNISINNIYIHHLDLLKRFILYFKETASELIVKAEKEKISIPNRSKEQNDDISRLDIKNFLEETKINKLSIRVKGHDFYISRNEAKILALMKSGYTAKEISTEIGLAKKTVEIYRDKLKIQLNLFSSNNLVSCARSNTLLNIDFLD